jgi:energy-coupling factor transporter ATP-binding protein EcfA2
MPARRHPKSKMETFDVRPPIPAAAKSFSGGNQQKIVVAREIERNPDLLLVGQPTRGVDIGAIEFIHKQIVALRDAGKAILLVSVELDEIMSLSDRIAVMFDGRIMGFRDPKRPTRRTGPADGRHRRQRGGRLMDRLPRWADVVLVPLVSLLLAALISALVILSIGEDPMEALKVMVEGSARTGLWLGLYALLHHQLHLHRPGRDGGLPRRPVQHRRRGAGAAGRPWGGAGLPLHALAALVAGADRRRRWARRPLARPGRPFRPGCRPSAAAIS